MAARRTDDTPGRQGIQRGPPRAGRRGGKAPRRVASPCDDAGPSRPPRALQATSATRLPVPWALSRKHLTWPGDSGTRLLARPAGLACHQSAVPSKLTRQVSSDRQPSRGHSPILRACRVQVTLHGRSPRISFCWTGLKPSAGVTVATSIGPPTPRTSMMNRCMLIVLRTKATQRSTQS